ncbi:BON domain-containing protein [Ramlibacter sp. MAHUQ-53]|uniref:BON domain-containing protein n=1 Tax=unclassified Ramlibacter TaxID=2617605 RepID=UPI0036423E4D
MKNTLNRHARALALAALTGLALGTTGCTVMRGQSTVGTYVDDAAITASVKAKLLEDKTTGGMSINVDTLNGTVALSGFAKSQAERTQAEALARSTKGVRDVRNNLIVRPPAS